MLQGSDNYLSRWYDCGGARRVLVWTEIHYQCLCFNL